MTADQVSFGRQTVPADEKEGLVRGVFDSVAPHYDLMNDLMSGGLHRVWKSVLLDRIAPQRGMVLLDVAGGTGDIARSFLDRAASSPDRDQPPAEAMVCDINHAMMKEGRGREQDGDRILDFVCGSAEALPLPDKSVDIYTIGFGLRNVTNRDKALAEARRVLRTGGRFFCLEFSRPITEGLGTIYDAYSQTVIPRLGAAVAGDRDAYDYLVESIKRFPSQSALLAEVEDAGFRRCKVENLTGGIVAIHSGWVY